MTMQIALGGLGGLILFGIIGGLVLHCQDKRSTRNTIGDCTDADDD